MAPRWRAKSTVGARVDDEECAQQIPKSRACKEESTNRPRSWITLASMSDRLPARHPWRQLSARQTLAAMHRELGLIRHARNQRSRFLDKRLDVFGFERCVMSSHAGPDLRDPHRLGLLG